MFQILLTWDILLQKEIAFSFLSDREGKYLNIKYLHKIPGKMLEPFIYCNSPALKTIQTSVCLITIHRAM